MIFQLIADTLVKIYNIQVSISNTLIGIYKNRVGVIAIIFKALNLSAKLLLLYCGRFNLKVIL
jgi:hypothetical protein